jgi:Flp pilus assembly CpaE family ATPase
MPAASSQNPVADLIAGAEAALGELNVPRITIHAFCRYPETAEAMDRAASDRRLARATTLVHDGGLPEALARYQNEPTPSLIVAESDDDPSVLLGQLDSLAEVCDPGTKVVVVGAQNDIGLYRELMRRGVSEYLVPPLQPLQLIRTITGLYVDPTTPFVGRTLAFVGAKGGVGASTIAHNVAYGLAELMQANTVIVDFDLAFGTAGLDFNQDPLNGVADALSQPDRLDPVLLDRMMVRCTDKLSLFAAPATLDADWDISPEAFEEVTTQIRSTAPFVVLDLPHLWSGWMRRALIAAIGGLFADPAQPFVGRTIAFVGARGGAGASAVAHNTAYAMSERIGVNTVIVDYDLPFGTAGLDFNQDPLGGVADALSQPDRLDATLLDRMMVRCTDKLSLFAAPATLETDWDIGAEAFEEVTSRIRATAPFVVLDLPHLWSGWMRRALIAADEVVVVATPDLASLRNAKNMIDLIRQGRPNDAPPRLVLNQVGVPGRPEIPAKDFGAALGLHPSLSIPFDAKVFGAAANNGQMVLDSASKTKAAEAFETLAQIVSRRELPTAPTRGRAKAAPAKAAGGGSLFASLFSKKR